MSKYDIQSLFFNELILRGIEKTFGFDSRNSPIHMELAMIVLN